VTRSYGVLIAALVVTLVAPVSSQVDELTARAAVLVNVAKFVEWTTNGPPADGGFVIAVSADAAFFEALTGLTRGARLHDRVVHIRRAGSANEPCACQVLFVSAEDGGRAAALLRTVRSNGVLTIGETPAFLREGGIVRIYREDARLRLQINVKSAEGSGLQISSRLLSLASRAQ
jgi:hypothetical protein